MLPSANVLRDNPQALAATATGAIVVVAILAYRFFHRGPTPLELEQRRRTRLASLGRIIDGTLVDTAPHDEAPQALIYRYRISGVTYECGQDVSALTPHLPDLGPSSALFETPVQVRYDRNNPADSIVVSETWNGLWNHEADPPAPLSWKRSEVYT